MTKKFDDLNQAFHEVTDVFDKRIPDFVYEKLVGMWNKFGILSKPFSETIDVLEKLKKKYKLVIISNSDCASINQVLDKYDLRKYFKKIYVSCDTGLLKSNKKSFETALKDLKLKKSDVLMVGDSMESDVKAADNVGIKAVLVDRNERREYENKIKDLTELEKFL